MSYYPIDCQSRLSALRNRSVVFTNDDAQLRQFAAFPATWQHTDTKQTHAINVSYMLPAWTDHCRALSACVRAASMRERLSVCLSASLSLCRSVALSISLSLCMSLCLYPLLSAFVRLGSLQLRHYIQMNLAVHTYASIYPDSLVYMLA